MAAPVPPNQLNMSSRQRLVAIFSVFILLFVKIEWIECKNPNFVLFLTDDQDLLLDGMLPMYSTLKHIANEGLTFTEAYVHTPICCPSRSSLLTGKYLHNMHVFNNSISGNCSSVQWQETQETQSIAAHLKLGANYVNFYAGKYLNQYGNKHANGLTHIPAGYDWWYGLEGNSKYYNFSLSINGSRVVYHDEYLTDLMRTFAKDFLNNRVPDRPFFMTLATPAPHAPFTPAKRHEKMFPAVTKKITPNFNASTESKHWLLQLPPKHLPSDASILDDIQRMRMQALLSVDELVAFVLRELDMLQILNETYLIFTSDNGYHIGQFGLPWDKRQPYQTDVHIPFIMRGPHIPKKQLFPHPISLVDVAPTILTLANVPVPLDMDGVSFAHLLPLNNSNVSTVSTQIFIEYFGEGNVHSVETSCNFTEEDSQNLSECRLENWCKCQDSRNNTYSCLVNFDKGKTFKYCSFVTDFVEAYNLTADPFELHNIAHVLDASIHKTYERQLLKYKTCKGVSCRLEGL